MTRFVAECKSIARVSLHVRPGLFRGHSAPHVPQLATCHPEDGCKHVNLLAVPGGGNVIDNNARWQDTIREIYDRVFRASGML